MEYYCQVLDGDSSCYLERLRKLQKRVRRGVVTSLVASIELLDYLWNVASLSLFYKYYYDRYLSEMTELVPLPYFRRRSTRYSDRLNDFSVTIPRCFKDIYVNSFFPP